MKGENVTGKAFQAIIAIAIPAVRKHSGGGQTLRHKANIFMVKQNCEGGIYRITLLADGRTYIGRTRNEFRHRWNEHRRDLKKGIHVNSYLQRCWDKYGADAFEFAILEPVARLEDLHEAEARWMLFYGATEKDRGFNLLGSVDQAVPCSSETRAKNSAATKKKWEDPEYREKILISRHKTRSTEEYKEKAKAQYKKLWKTPEFQQKMREGKRYLSDCPEYKEKLSQASLKMWQTPGHREKVSASLKKFYQSDHGREMMREIGKAAWDRPGYREQQRETFRQNTIKARGFDYEVTMKDGSTCIVVDTLAFCTEHGISYKTFASRARDGGTMRNGWKIRQIPRPKGT